MRCGAEAGKIKRLLDEHEISWGYYTDHNPFEPHCNAHPNNLVVLDPEHSRNQNVLAVLDLDLAYSFEPSFVNTIEADPEFFTDEENLEIQRRKVGTHDREQFDDWNNSEKYELELALGGQENMNFEFFLHRQNSEPGQQAEGVDTKAANQLMCALMRDFCVKSYREHYDRQGWLWSTSASPLTERYQKALPAIAALVRIAILLTKDCAI